MGISGPKVTEGKQENSGGVWPSHRAELIIPIPVVLGQGWEVGCVLVQHAGLKCSPPGAPPTSAHLPQCPSHLNLAPS